MTTLGDAGAPARLRRWIDQALLRQGVRAQTACTAVHRAPYPDQCCRYDDPDPGAVTLSQRVYDQLASDPDPTEPRSFDPRTTGDALRTLIHEHLHGCGPRLLPSTFSGLPRDDEVRIWGAADIERAQRSGDIALCMLHELDTELAARAFLRRSHGRPLAHTGGYDALLSRATDAVASVTGVTADIAWASLASAALTIKASDGAVLRSTHLWTISTYVAERVASTSSVPAIARALADVVSCP